MTPPLRRSTPTIEPRATIASRRVAPHRRRSAASAHDDLRSLEAGLDRLQTDRPTRRRARWRRFTTSVAAADRLRRSPSSSPGSSTSSSRSPGPTSCPARWTCSTRSAPAWESGRLQDAVVTSLERGVVGFLIAIVVGTPARPAARRGAAAAPRGRPDHLGPAGAAVGRVGARRDHLVRPVGCHGLLRHPDGRDPVDRQRPHRGRRPGAAAAAPRGHRARRRRARSSPRS